jgi:hypothetical protein
MKITLVLALLVLAFTQEYRVSKEFEGKFKLCEVKYCKGCLEAIEDVSYPPHRNRKRSEIGY